MGLETPELINLDPNPRSLWYSWCWFERSNYWWRSFAWCFHFVPEILTKSTGISTGVWVKYKNRPLPDAFFLQLICPESDARIWACYPIWLGSSQKKKTLRLPTLHSTCLLQTRKSWWYLLLRWCWFSLMSQYWWWMMFLAMVLYCLYVWCSTTSRWYQLSLYWK